MRGKKRLALRAVAATLVAIGAIWIALWYFIPAPPSTITIAAGIKGGAFEHIAKRYQQRLAQHHVALNIRLTDGSLDTVKLLHDPKSGVDAAFLLGGVTNGTESPGLVSLGRFSYSPIWIFYRGSESIQHLTQLKGKRLSIGLAASQIDTQILAAYGINAQNTALLPVAGPAAVSALRAGEADVIFLPQAFGTPGVQSLLHDPAIKLMNVVQAEALTRLFPSLNRIVLPQGVVDLERDIPASDVNLISLTDVVVARNNLHPELIYLLAQTMQEEHSGPGIFHRAQEFPTHTDPEFPFAEEALDFYKAGPSFLHRYLPFWMVNVTKRSIAVSVTVLAIVIPFFTYAPKLYDWLLNLQLVKLYRRLRAVDVNLQQDLTIDQLKVLKTDLENINLAAHSLPMRHSDLFVALHTYIDHRRTQLISRLAGLRS